MELYEKTQFLTKLPNAASFSGLSILDFLFGFR
jgi:hypothetical protein